MLAAQGKPLAHKGVSLRARKVESLAVLTLFSVSLFAFAFALAASTPLVASGQEAASESQADVDRLLFGQNERQQLTEEPKSEYFYDLQREEKRGEFESGRQQQQQVDSSQPVGKFTTLLEDEDDDDKQNKPLAVASNGTSIKTTNPNEVKVSETRLDKQNDKEEDVKPRATAVASTTSSMGSMFTRMWNSIASYLPYFNQMVSKKVNNDNKATESSRNTGTNAKPSVSNAVTMQVKDEAKDGVVNSTGAANMSDQNEVTGNNHIGQGEDKLEKVKISEKGTVKDDDINNNQIQKDSKDESGFSSLGTFESVKVEGKTSNINRAAAGQQTLENSKRVHLEADEAINIDAVLQQQQQPLTDADQVNFIRSSNLLMPMSSDDEMLVRQGSKSPLASGGLVSRYIYAPTHHYYLTPNSKLTPFPMHSSSADPLSSSSSSGADPSEQPPMMSHRSFQGQHQRQFLPGQHIFGSYDTLKPAYAFQKDGLEGIALVNGNGGVGLAGNINKSSNDIYFLVMVGAFCVMAMAVVLAAGLFAYRVQQNRKCSQDTDYPTYGVVGPNNMDGKCGAAAFMGGYLGGGVGGGGPGSSGSFGSKSGSSKHLPDMYASDSGLASIDKGSSKKASLASASSATTPQDHHNNNSNNNNNHHHHPNQQQLQSSSANRSTPTGNSVANNQDAARMYHYQRQKQQMIISDRGAAGGRHTSASDLDSEEENEDGSYTVYECPGLASAHEMEIKNPLFNDDQSP